MMNQGQQKIHDECIEWFRSSSQQVFEIAGAAGTGKTFLIFEILRTLGLGPENYLAMAYTGQAAIIMRTRGFITARSIHSSLYEVVEVTYDSLINERFGVPTKKKTFRKRRSVADSIQLFFIDEAFMVPEYMKADILSFNKKVIACGDPNQLPPIDGAPAFLINPGVHRLTQLMRQASNNPIVYISQRILNREPIHYGVYGNTVLVIDQDEFDEKMIGMVDVVGVCTNRTRQEINWRVREICGFENPLPYHGERIVCCCNNWNVVYDDLALANGLAGIAYGERRLNPKNKKTFYMDFAPDMTGFVFPNINMNIEYFNAPFDRQKEMKSIVKSKYDKIEGELFEYAYASTIWKLQGSETDNVMYIEEGVRPQIKMALDYTAVTRAKRFLIIVKQKKTLW